MRSITLRRTALAAALAVPLSCFAQGYAGDDTLGFEIWESPDAAQQEGAVVTDLHGNEVVVWKEAAGDTLRMLAQGRSAGQSSGGPISVLAEYGIDGSPQALAAAPSYRGGVALWQAASDGIGGTRVVARRFFDDGGLEGSEFVIAEEVGVSHAEPAIGMSRNGYHYAVAWRATDALGRDDVMMAPYVLDSRLEVPVAVNAPGTAVGGPPQVAMIGEDDSIVVVWIGTTVPGAPADMILARRFTSWGMPTSDTVQLYQNAAPISELRVAQWGDDGFAMLFGHPGPSAAHYVRLYQGLSFQRDFSVPSIRSATNGRLAVDRLGGITVAHDVADEFVPELTRVRVVRLDAEGQLTSELTLAGGEWTGERLADLAVDADGDATVLRERPSEMTLARLDGRRVLHERPIDLQLDVTTPQTVGQGDGFFYEVRVRNTNEWSGDGVDSTSGFLVEAVLPPEAQIQWTYDIGWLCDPLQPSRILCRYLWPLAAGEESTPLSVGAVAPQTSLDMTGQVSLLERHVDPDPADNTVGVVTAVRDMTADALAFVERTGVVRGSEQVSEEVVVSGIEVAVDAFTFDGEISRNGGAWLQSASVVDGDRLRVRHVASDAFGGRRSTTLNINGVHATFTTTTEARDTTPDAFAFADRVDVGLGLPVTSVPVTIAGINDVAAIGIVGGSYSINGGAYTGMPGSVRAGDVVRVQHTAAPTPATAVDTVLTVGGVSDTFTSTTVPVDTTPDTFAFAAQHDVALGSERTSAEVQVFGINAAAPVSVSGGSYSIDGGPFTTAAGSLVNGQRVRLRHVASTAFSTSTSTQLSIGGGSASFTSTTLARDTSPDAFAFADRNGVATAIEVISAPITIAGINVAAPVAVTGGSYSVNGGAFTTASGNVVAGDSLRVRHVSAASANTAVTTTLTIGGVADGFTSTTGSADSTPNAFAFADITGAKRNKSVTSAPVTVAGINVAVPIAVSGGGARWSKNGGAYTTAAGSVAAGDVVRVQLTMPNASNATVNVQVTIGGVADTWSVTTGN